MADLCLVLCQDVQHHCVSKVLLLEGQFMTDYVPLLLVLVQVFFYCSINTIDRNATSNHKRPSTVFKDGTFLTSINQLNKTSKSIFITTE